MVKCGMMTLNAVVKTQMMLNAQVDKLSRKTHKKKFHKLVVADCKLQLSEITEKLKISEGCVFTIFINLCQWESCIQNGCRIFSQSIKNNNSSTIQSIVRNCFNATKRSFCINMSQGRKHGSTASLGSQISSQPSGQQQVKAVQSDQRRKHQRAMFWSPYFGVRKVFCYSTTLRKEELSIANIM